MAKFYVKVMEVHTQVIEVEAIDEEDARNVASEIVSTGIQQDGTALPDETGYDYGIESSEWLVFQ
jgi:hypothetical protein